MIVDASEKAPALRFVGFTEQWDEKALGDLYTERAEEGSDALQVLSVSIHDGVSDHELDTEALGKLIRRSADKRLYKRVHEGDVVLNMMRAWQGAIGVTRTEGMVSPAYITAKPNGESSPRFMDHTLRRAAIVKQMNDLSYGVTDFRKRLYWDSFERVVVRIPSVDEQRRIGSVFDQLNKLIDLRRRELEKLRQFKQAMLSQMFPKPGQFRPAVRFSGFSEPWVEMSFRDAFRPLKNRSHSRAELNSDGGEVMTVHYGDILVKYRAVVDCSRDRLPFVTGAHRGEFSGLLLRDGDVLMADAAEDESVGACVELAGIGSASVIAGLHTIACRPVTEFQPGYLGHYLNAPSYHDQLLPLMQGTKVLSLSRNNLSRTVVRFPNPAEQRLIGEFLSHLDELIALQERKGETLVQVKRSLLDTMFV